MDIKGYEENRTGRTRKYGKGVYLKTFVKQELRISCVKKYFLKEDKPVTFRHSRLSSQTPRFQAPGRRLVR